MAWFELVVVIRTLIKPYLRWGLVGLLLASAAGLVVSVYGVITATPEAGKWFAVSGLLATMAGIIQFDVSGLIDRILEPYSDEEKYPGGPPSYITRQVIDNRDTPVRTWFRNIVFFNMRTGFWLVLGGTAIQVLAVWL